MQVISFTGRSNSGKTLTIEALVRHWKAQGLRVGVLKHCPKGYQLDHEGKDSARVYGAGADVVGVAGPDECAVRWRSHGGMDPLALVERAFPSDLEVVVLEGFRAAPVPHVVVLEARERIPVDGADVGVVAWVHPFASTAADRPVFRPGDGGALAAFLCDRLGIGRVARQEANGRDLEVLAARPSAGEGPVVGGAEPGNSAHPGAGSCPGAGGAE